MSASNCSIEALRPHDLNLPRMYSATLRLAGAAGVMRLGGDGSHVLAQIFWRRNRLQPLFQVTLGGDVCAGKSAYARRLLRSRWERRQARGRQSIAKRRADGWGASETSGASMDSLLSAAACAPTTHRRCRHGTSLRRRSRNAHHPETREQLSEIRAFACRTGRLADRRSRTPRTACRNHGIRIQRVAYLVSSFQFPVSVSRFAV